MTVPFDEYQRRKNMEFYKGKGVEFGKEFKTFAADSRFAGALALDFYRRFAESGKETINVYEFGVGDGSLGIRFLMELRKLGEQLAEKTVYRFCDFSDELVKHAVKRADAFGFNSDGIVYDAIEEPKFLRDACYILANELYDDLPTKLLVRDGKKVMEIAVENGKKKPVPFEGDGELAAYMMKMPDGYWIPVNISAKKHLDYCAGRLAPDGYIDIFDYGFRKEEITGMPAEMWNNAMIREFGGQIRKNLACSEMEFPTDGQLTIDVNFDFLSRGLDAKIETQLEFIEKVLGEKLHEVETDRLRYFDDEEIRKSGKELKKYGYEGGFQKDLKESRGYLHMRVG